MQVSDMPKAFLRYQLQNSIRQLSPSPTLFEAVLGVEQEKITAQLAEFEEIRGIQMQRLKESCVTELAALHGKRVLFLGDSLTADELGYRVLVSSAAALEARNAAISGATTSSLLPICRHRIFSKTSPVPEVISIMLGTNDAVSIGREEMHLVSLGEYLRNMREILTWSKKTGARVLLFAIPAVLEQRFCAHAAASGRLQSNRAIATYNAGLAALAAELGIELIAHVAQENESYFEKDGLHWSVQGQTHFAEQWLRAAYKAFNKEEKA